MNWWNRIQGFLLDHFWGIIESTFITTAIGLATNVGEKLAVNGMVKPLELGLCPAVRT
jgi:hypothetical protein